MALSLAEQDIIYGSGFGLYEKGNYLEASELFTQLLLENPYDIRYWRGLAAARQMEKNYEMALNAWALVAILEDKDPLPHYHAAECLLSMGDKDEAQKALLAAEDRLGISSLDNLREKIECLKTMQETVK